MAHSKSGTTLMHWLRGSCALMMLVSTFIIWLMALLITVVISDNFRETPEEIKEAYSRQHAAAEAFTAKGKASDARARQDLAVSLLGIHRQGVPVDMLKDDKVMQQVKHIATSGDRIDLQPKPFSFLDHHRTILIVAASLLYLTWAVLLCMLHLEYCRERNLAYNNLPWRAGWPWLLLLLSPLLLWPLTTAWHEAREDARSNASTPA